ncbi:MAG: CopG family transcriptional regulator [Chlamydiae bacterium]|nr:MAG: CopG family transcriptional regulator [Chlamydiota bacterium]
MTTNITVRVDAEIARQAKIIAAQKGTSLSAMVGKWLSTLSNRTSEYEKARKRHEKLMEKGLNLGVYGKPTWTREELHERR